MSLKDFKDEIAKFTYGMTRDEAHAKGICIACKKPPALNTDVDKQEYAISGLCPSCFHDATVDYADEH